MPWPDYPILVSEACRPHGCHAFRGQKEPRIIHSHTNSSVNFALLNHISQENNRHSVGTKREHFYHSYNTLFPVLSGKQTLQAMFSFQTLAFVKMLIRDFCDISVCIYLCPKHYTLARARVYIYIYIYIHTYSMYVHTFLSYAYRRTCTYINTNVSEHI